MVDDDDDDDDDDDEVQYIDDDQFDFGEAVEDDDDVSDSDDEELQPYPFEHCVETDSLDSSEEEEEIPSSSTSPTDQELALQEEIRYVYHR